MLVVHQVGKTEFIIIIEDEKWLLHEDKFIHSFIQSFNKYLINTACQELKLNE